MLAKKIILVEDNKSDIDLTLRAFKKANIQNPIVILEDGKDALDYLFCQDKYAANDINEQPELILLDLKLPIIDGIQVLKEIRSNKKTRHYIVIILTSSKEESDLVTSYDLGVNSYIRKPVDFTEFVDVIKQIGVYWILLNESPNSIN
jgi:two-component system, response regulator